MPWREIEGSATPVASSSDADDFNRTLNGVVRAVSHACLARLQRNFARIRRQNFVIGVGADSGHGLEQLPCILDSRGIAHVELYFTILDAEIRILDVARAECPSNIVESALEPLALRRIDIDLEKKITSALEIEAEVDLAREW